jgi:hypothetical protein
MLVLHHTSKQAAVELGSMKMGDFVNEWALLILFGFGSSLTGWMIGKEKLTLGQSYGRLLITIGFIVFIAMVSGERELHLLSHARCFECLHSFCFTIIVNANAIYMQRYKQCTLSQSNSFAIAAVAQKVAKKSVASFQTLQAMYICAQAALPIVC